MFTPINRLGRDSSNHSAVACVLVAPSLPSISIYKNKEEALLIFFFFSELVDVNKL